MFCGDAIGISTVLAFSCGRAKTIRTRNVWTRIFFFLENEGEKFRFQMYPDTYGRGLLLQAHSTY